MFFIPGGFWGALGHRRSPVGVSGSNLGAIWYVLGRSWAPFSSLFSLCSSWVAGRDSSWEFARAAAGGLVGAAAGASAGAAAGALAGAEAGLALIDGGSRCNVFFVNT